ncbi:unnamed protein product, partial [marine sediment metagenome]
IDEPFLAFCKADGKLAVAENLYSMVFNPDGSEKTEKCLQRPVKVETHAQGMKADFVYGNWVLAQDESLEIDPATATLSDPTKDGHIKRAGDADGDYANCMAADLTRELSNPVYIGGGYSFDRRYAYRTFTEWDISSLAGGTLTANPVFRYKGVGSDATDGEINPLTEEAPSVATDANLWEYIASGIAYVDPFSVSIGINSINLGVSAKSDLQTAMNAPQSWFATGFQSAADECLTTGDADRFYRIGELPPTLYVEYTPPYTPENKSAGMAAK